MNNLKENKGITLIALVITIIVLLILAGVAISALSEEDGVVNKAQQAKEDVHISNDRETLDLAVIQYKSQKTADVTMDEGEDFVSFLSQKNEDWTVTQEDNDVIITVNSCGHTYAVNLDDIATNNEITIEQITGTEESEDVPNVPEEPEIPNVPDVEEEPETPVEPDVPEKPYATAYLWEVVQNGDYVDYYGTEEIEQYSWQVLDVDKDAQKVKLIRAVCWYDQMKSTPLTVEEHNALADEVVRKNNKYYNPDFLESPEKVTALTVEEVKKNNGSFTWQGEIKNSYMVAATTCALVGYTPYDNSVYAIMSNGLIGMYALGNHYVRAVVELKPDVLVTEGDGTYDNKYQITIQD